MKTDHPICLFITVGAEAFRILTGGRRLEGDDRFCSITLKCIERCLDGIVGAAALTLFSAIADADRRSKAR